MKLSEFMSIWFMLSALLVGQAGDIHRSAWFAGSYGMILGLVCILKRVRGESK